MEIGKYKCFGDKIGDDNFNEYDLEGACDLLNDLSEENERLKETLSRIAIEIIALPKSIKFEFGKMLVTPDAFFFNKKQWEVLEDAQHKLDDIVDAYRHNNEIKYRKYIGGEKN